MKTKFSTAGFLFALSILCCGVSDSLAAPEPAKDSKDAKDAPPPAAPDANKAPDLEPGSNVICEVDIFYSWKRLPPKGRKVDEADLEPVKDFYITAGEEGLVQEEVTNRLTAKIPQFSLQAMQRCATAHQDQTSCVAAQMKSSSEHYARLDFVARRAMLEAINADCDEQAGECLASEVSDVKCRVNRPPDMQPQPSPAPADAAGAKGGKDAKDPKKK